MTLFCINLFAGPSSGKSVFASDLFSALKKRHYSVENTVEAAKDRILSGRANTLYNQITILGEQWERISQLEGAFDIAITDSPIPLCSIYAPDEYPASFHDVTWWCQRKFKRINFFVERQKDHFESAGRVHDMEESLIIDQRIKKMLDEQNEPYIILPAGEERLSIALSKIPTELKPKS